MDICKNIDVNGYGYLHIYLFVFTDRYGCINNMTGINIHTNIMYIYYICANVYKMCVFVCVIYMYIYMCVRARTRVQKRSEYVCMCMCMYIYTYT